MKFFAATILALLLLAGIARAQDAAVDSGDTASFWTPTQDPGHWEDQGYWYRDEDSWAWSEYWVWVETPQDKTVLINDEWVYLAANNQCTQANPCYAWGPGTVWGAHQGAVITGDFVLYNASEGSITWQIRGNGNMQWLVAPGTSCGRCRWQLIADRENPQVWIAWWGSGSFKVAMENISIDYNPLPPPSQPTFTKEQKDVAAASRDRARGYSQGMDYFAGLYAGKLDWWRSAVLLTGARLESMYADWQDKIVNDPPENDCSAWPVAHVDLPLTGDPQLDAIINQAGNYFAWLETAYHSSNRYMSGCGDWQRDYAIASLRYAGINMQYSGFSWLAGTLRQVGDISDPYAWYVLGCYGCQPQYYGTTAATILDGMDQEMRSTGSFYQNQ